MFRVAHALGMTVHQLGLTMSASELAEWIAYLGIINGKQEE